MSRWFRFYEETLYDPKVLRLSDSMYRAWTRLLCVASMGDGLIPKEDISIRLRVSEKGAQAIIDYLVGRKLLEDRGAFVVPNNWNGRQYKSDKTDPTAPTRQKNYRKNKAVSENVTDDDCNAERNATVTVTATRAETETETDTEQNRSEQIHAKFLEIAKTDLDDPNLYGSLYGIQQLLSAGYLPETIYAGAASAMRGKDKPPNWAYFAKVIQSENERRAAPAKIEKGAFTPSVAVAPDEKALDFYKKFGRWHRDYGPEPGRPGCRASPDLLAKYGYQTEAA